MPAVAGSAGAAEGATEGAGRVYEQPCATGMRELFVRTLKKGGVSPTDIDYFGESAVANGQGYHSLVLELYLFLFIFI
jgi:hypothetical protein